MVPRDNSLELSTHSQYSTYKTDPLQRREGVTSEILTLRGGKGVVVRWKRKDAVEVLEGQQQHHQGKSSMDINHMNQHHHGHSSSTNHSTAAIAHKSQCPRGPKVSRAIRSTYTGKSIESKKKVIRMLFVLVAEFFLCWTPLHFVVSLHFHCMPTLVVAVALYNFERREHYFLCRLIPLDFPSQENIRQTFVRY